MEVRERMLYHQIHPLKLATDWGSGGTAAYLLWQHRLALAGIVGLVPPVIASALLIARADLERYATSRFGRYLKRHMTRTMEGLRLAGALLIWAAAWWHTWPALVAGVLVVLAAWARGWWWTDRRSHAA